MSFSEASDRSKLSNLVQRANQVRNARNLGLRSEPGLVCEPGSRVSRRRATDRNSRTWFNERTRFGPLWRTAAVQDLNLVRFVNQVHGFLGGERQIETLEPGSKSEPGSDARAN